jgi:hypothetical protein
VLSPACPDVAQGHSLERRPKGFDTDRAGDFVDNDIPSPGQCLWSVTSTPSPVPTSLTPSAAGANATTPAPAVEASTTPRPTVSPTPLPSADDWGAAWVFAATFAAVLVAVTASVAIALRRRKKG